MMELLEEAYSVIAQDREMVRGSFDVCGITSTDPEEIRKESFYWECMGKMKRWIDGEQYDKLFKSATTVNLFFQLEYLILDI